MSTATPEAPASSTKTGRAPDHSEGDVAVWIKDSVNGKTYASISYGPMGKKQRAQACCDVPGLDGPLTAKEIALIFSGQPVEVSLQPKDATKKPYTAILGRNSDALKETRWKNDPTKVDHWLEIRSAIPVMREKKDRKTEEVQRDEQGNPVMELKAYSIGKDRVQYPVWHKHGEKTFIAISAIDALYLDNKQPRQVQWNGKTYNFELLDIVAREGTKLKPDGTPTIFLNPKISVTVPGEKADQARGAAVDYEETAEVGAAEEEQGIAPNQVPF